MCFTTIIAYISSALDDAKIVDDPLFEIPKSDLICNLRLLNTFVYCSRKLRNYKSFRLFLADIEEKLRQEAANSHGIYQEKRLKQFTDSLMDRMDKWYVIILDRTCTPHSTSLMTTSEVLEILTSVLECVMQVADITHPWYVQLRFLKSFIHFVTIGNTEAKKDLLYHSEYIAVNTAYELFRGLHKHHFFDRREMDSRLWTVVQWIKPINPLVYLIYTQSLCGLKLSKQLLVDDDALSAVKNFLDSILYNFPEILYLNHHYKMIFMENQLQEMHERLTSLKVILKQHTTNISIEIWEEVADVVAVVGISMCSVFQPQIDVINFWHQPLLDKVLLKIAETVPQKPLLNPPRTSSYGFVDCILEKLIDLTSSECESVFKSHVQTIQVELAFIRASLGEAVELSDENVEAQTLWDRLLEVAFKVESAIDYQAINPLLNSTSASFDSIIQDIGNIKEDLLKIEVKETRSRPYSHLPSHTTPSAPNEVIGFHDEEISVLDQLWGGTKHLRLIAIVGMPGVGKTTLASKVYNHSSNSYHFKAKAWCSISQVLDKKKVLIDLLKQICPDITSMSEHDLAEKLWHVLRGKRYLIFLDDIWSTEAWNSLKDSFPDDSWGSRIIFTSRYYNIAPREILNQETVTLRPLNEVDSMNLMCSKLFPGKGYGFPPEKHDIGMQVVEKCGGLPLAIINVAGVLANAEEKTWKGIMDNFSFVSGEGNCRYTWEFSYKHLPDYLKPCFLYFGVFPEDQEVSVRRLFRLWIAEGFIRKSETHSPEDVAECYLNMLIGRSLIMVAKRRSDGGVKTCCIHDLLHDFCLEKAKDEHFFHFTKGYDELYSSDVPHNLRRLLIDYKALSESSMYYHTSFSTRSLLLRAADSELYKGMSYMLKSFKLLKVLDLKDIHVGYVFPSAIEQLVLLAFLAIKASVLIIPSWLANLSNLETLIILALAVSLPGTLWNMQKLKYLYIRDFLFNLRTGGGGTLPIDNLDDSPMLCELNRFTGAEIDWCNMEKQLSKFPNIRKLMCLLTGLEADQGEYADKFVFPDFSSKLESLHMCGRLLRYVGSIRFEFLSLTKLKKLKLSAINLYWEIFSIIGNQLPSLEVLKLDYLKFNDEVEYIWEMKSGEFSKLRILHLRGMPIRRWIACDDHEFENCFQKLVITHCNDLMELPCCLEMITTLEEIEVSYCTEDIEDLVKRIGFENSYLKLTFRSWRFGSMSTNSVASSSIVV